MIGASPLSLHKKIIASELGRAQLRFILAVVLLGGAFVTSHSGAYMIRDHEPPSGCGGGGSGGGPPTPTPTPGPSLRLKSRTFVPTPGLSPAANAALQALGVPQVHAILQFKSAPLDQQLDQLEGLGVLFSDYLPDNAFL